MKRKIAVLVVSLFSVLSFGQEHKVKKIKEKVKAVRKTIRIYHTLNDDPTVKHGSYEEYFKKKLIVKGNYKLGVKDGEWVYMSPSGAYFQKGSFKDGKSIGKWEKKKLNTTTRFCDYDANGVIKDDVNSGGESLTRIESTPALLFKDEKKYNKLEVKDYKNYLSKIISSYLESNIDKSKYSDLSKNSNQLFRIMAMVRINEYGEVLVGNVKSNSPKLTKEIKELLLKFPTIIPGSNNGKNINLVLAIRFVIRIEAKNQTESFGETNNRASNF